MTALLLSLLLTAAPCPTPGEKAVTEEDLSSFVREDRSHSGSTSLYFQLPPGTRRLEVDLLEDLRGAKVDVRAHVQGRTFTLLDERRTAGQLLVVDLTRDDVQHVEVRVHHHFRSAPVVRRARVERCVPR